MITGGRIVAVEAKREKEGPVEGTSISMNIDSVEIKGEEITVNYTFTVRYDKDIGYLKMSGVLTAKEDAKKAKEIAKEWSEKEKERRRLPNDFAESVLNMITYTCGINGIFVVQPVRLAPPIQLPRMRVGEQPKEGTTA